MAIYPHFWWGWKNRQNGRNTMTTFKSTTPSRSTTQHDYGRGLKAAWELFLFLPFFTVPFIHSIHSPPSGLHA